MTFIVMWQLRLSLLIFRIYTIELYPRILIDKAFGLCKALASFAVIFSPLMQMKFIPLDEKTMTMTM